MLEQKGMGDSVMFIQIYMRTLMYISKHTFINTLSYLCHLSLHFGRHVNTSSHV